MTDTTDTNIAADNAKELALEIGKGVVESAAGYFVAVALTAGVATVAHKLRARKADKDSVAHAI